MDVHAILLWRNKSVQNIANRFSKIRLAVVWNQPQVDNPTVGGNLLKLYKYIYI